MSRGIAKAFAECRFLLLTLLICAYLLAMPLTTGNWPVQLVLEVLLLAAVLVTVSANPVWLRLRRVLAAGMLAFVRRQPTLTVDSMFASVAAYLLQADMTYFSLVTLATVGFGDILPATHTARMLAMIQAVVGIFYVAGVVALFVGTYSSQRRE